MGRLRQGSQDDAEYDSVIVTKKKLAGNLKRGLLICRVVTLYQPKNVKVGKNYSF